MIILTVNSMVIGALEDGSSYVMDSEKVQFSRENYSMAYMLVEGDTAEVYTDVADIDVPADCESKYSYDGTTFTAL